MTKEQDGRCSGARGDDDLSRKISHQASDILILSDDLVLEFAGLLHGFVPIIQRVSKTSSYWVKKQKLTLHSVTP